MVKEKLANILDEYSLQESVWIISNAAFGTCYYHEIESILLEGGDEQSVLDIIDKDSKFCDSEELLLELNKWENKVSEMPWEGI